MPKGIFNREHLKPTKHGVYGWGINDSTTPITWKVDGKSVYCPIYVRWASMIQRCQKTTKKPKENSTHYRDCSVHIDWKFFLILNLGQKSRCGTALSWTRIY